MTQGVAVMTGPSVVSDVLEHTRVGRKDRHAGQYRFRLPSTHAAPPHRALRRMFLDYARHALVVE